MGLPFLDKLTQYCKTHNLFEPGNTVLVGFSGGPDSTALILSLNHLKAVYGLKIMAAHMNFNLRGEESDDDEDFVKSFCFERNISVVVKSVQLCGSSGTENEARKLRFSWFNKLAKLYGVNRIALGHNMGDQAETVLFRFARGSGFTGLKGILPKSGNIVHPLLEFTRAEILTFLMQNQIIYQTDSTNNQNEYSRNKIRNQLIPWIETNLNPNIIERIAANANVFWETEQVLRENITTRLKSLLTTHSDTHLAVPIKKIKKMYSVQRFYLYRLLYEQLFGEETDFYTVHANEIDKLLDSDGSKIIDLPHDIVVRKEYNQLVFMEKPKQPDLSNSLELSSIRSRFLFEHWRFTMKKLKKYPPKSDFNDKMVALLDLSLLEFPLTIRHRQDGDRFIPLGMKKPKKLKNFFIDEKISRFERDFVPIVCDANKIIWVGGHRVDSRAAIKADSTQFLRITIEPVPQRRRSATRKKADDE